MAGRTRSGSEQKSDEQAGKKSRIRSARERSSRRSNKIGFGLLGKKRSPLPKVSERKRPPVMTRRVQSDMATPAKRKPSRGGKQPRRRYDLTLDVPVPGAEIRLPSLPVVRVSWRIVSGLLTLMMLFCSYVLLFSPVFQVELIEVEGLERIEFSEINQSLKITGEQIVGLDTESIRADLKEVFPSLKDVRVSFGLPASVYIQVTERQPAITWVHGDEANWVDEEGIVFPIRGEWGEPLLTVEAENLPMVSEPSNRFDPDGEEIVIERLDPKVVKQFQSIQAYVPEGKAMVYDDRHGVGWKDGRGWRVYLGRQLGELDQKLLVYQAIVDRLQVEGIKPALISVEYLHAPFYRMER